MKQSTYTLAFLIIAISNLYADDSTRVLVFTGGHGFDRAEFFTIFNEMENIQYSEIQHPNANWILTDDYIHNYDVIVLYDMWQDITEEQKNGMQAYLDSGKGMVVLHHALVNYQNWDGFLDIAGCRYVLEQDGGTINGKKVPASTYKHDINMTIDVVDENHPVSNGLVDFKILDEGYGQLYYKDNIHPIMTTNHPDNSSNVVWTTPHPHANVVAIQLGHDKKAFMNPLFQTLVENAVNWAAGDAASD